MTSRPTLDFLLLFPPLLPLITHPELGMPQLTANLRLHGFRTSQADLNALMLAKHLRSASDLRRLLTRLHDDERSVARAIIPSLEQERRALQQAAALPADHYRQYAQHLSDELLSHLEGTVPHPFSLHASHGSALPWVDAELGTLAAALADPPFLPWLIAVKVAELAQHASTSPPAYDRETVQCWVQREDPWFDEFLRAELEPLLRDNPRVVALSVHGTEQLVPTLRIARWVRERSNAIVVMGGPWCAAAQSLLTHLDFLYDYVHAACPYEGEEPLLALGNALSEARPWQDAPGWVVRRGPAIAPNPPPSDRPLHSIAGPTFDGLDFALYKEALVPFRTIRGCYWGRCLFCYHVFDHTQSTTRPSRGPRMQDAQVQALLGTLRSARLRASVGLTLADNATPPSHLEQVADALCGSAMQVAWNAMVRFDRAFTPELCGKLARSGCQSLAFGLETCSEPELVRLRKGINRSIVRDCLAACTDAGIETSVFLLDYPSAPASSYRESLEYVCDHHDVIRRFIPMRFELARNAAAYAVPETFAIEPAVEASDSLSVFRLPFRAGDWSSDDEFRAATLAYAAKFVRLKALDAKKAEPPRVSGDGPNEPPQPAMERDDPANVQLARAIATCGKGLAERHVLVADAGERVWSTLSSWHGEAIRLLWFGGDEVAGRIQSEAVARLGDRVRVGAVAKGAARHAVWSASALPRPVAGQVTILHLQDEQAARRVLVSSATAVHLPPHCVLAESCRWTPGLCPARQLRMVSLQGPASARACPSSPDFGDALVGDIQAKIQHSVSDLEQRRSCSSCPVRDSCARCSFTGRLSEAQYCDLRRALGAAGLGTRLRGAAAGG